MATKIDVHAHFLPPFYADACREHGYAQPDGWPFLPEWTAESHLELMDRLGIQKSILSISSPGVHLVPGDNVFAKQLARRCNEYGCMLKRNFPDRFGYFASLPLMDVDASLEEISQALAEGCDGFVLLTNVHGIYLGDKQFDPIFDELNRRNTLIFIHPTTPRCRCLEESASSSPHTTDATPLISQWPNPLLEFMFDTTRVFSNLFMSGTMQRCPKIRLILPHLGAAFAPMLSRWTGFSTLTKGPWLEVSEDEVKEVLKRQIWFDMAGFPFPTQIRCLINGVGVHHSRLLYGSDFPFTPLEGVIKLLGLLEQGVRELFTESEVQDILHNNATQLLMGTGITST